VGSFTPDSTNASGGRIQALGYFSQTSGIKSNKNNCGRAFISSRGDPNYTGSSSGGTAESGVRREVLPGVRKFLSNTFEMVPAAEKRRPMGERKEIQGERNRFYESLPVKKKRGQNGEKKRPPVKKKNLQSRARRESQKHQRR